MMRLIALLCTAAIAASCVPEARASSTPALDVAALAAAAGVPLDVVQWVPGVGPAYVDSFSVSCTSAAAVQFLPSATVSYTAQNASTTLLHVGDSAIADPGTTRNAPVYCATNCPAQEFGGNTRKEYCRGDTDVTIYVRALVSLTAAP